MVTLKVWSGSKEDVKDSIAFTEELLYLDSHIDYIKDERINRHMGVSQLRLVRISGCKDNILKYINVFFRNQICSHRMF